MELDEDTSRVETAWH